MFQIKIGLKEKESLLFQHIFFKNCISVLVIFPNSIWEAKLAVSRRTYENLHAVYMSPSDEFKA